MHSASRFASLGGTVALLLSLAAACPAQDLGEVARQQKLKKTTSPPAKHQVITNEDIQTSGSSTTEAAPAAAQRDPARPESSNQTAATKPAPAEASKPSAAEVQAKIKVQKQKVLGLDADLTALEKELEKWKKADCTALVHRSDPTRNACDIPPKLVAERDRVKAELEMERATLEQMQEDARHMGYGNAVYDPD